MMESAKDASLPGAEVDTEKEADGAIGDRGVPFVVFPSPFFFFFFFFHRDASNGCTAELGSAPGIDPAGADSQESRNLTTLTWPAATCRREVSERVSETQRERERERWREMERKKLGGRSNSNVFFSFELLSIDSAHQINRDDDEIPSSITY